MKLVLAICLIALGMSAFAAEEAPASMAQTEPVAAPASDARLRHRARLDREITRLERELAGIPAGLGDEAGARDQARIVAGLEVWDLTVERSDLRQRIERLRQRITLLEQIQQRQDDLDRARLVEHQRALAELGSDRAVVRQTQDEARVDVQSAQRLIAAREAKREMLARLRNELEALGGAPAAPAPAPVSEPAPVISPTPEAAIPPAPTPPIPAQP